MPDTQLDYPNNRKTNPQGDGSGRMVAIAAGTLAVAAIIYWLTMGEAKASEAKEPVPPPPPEPDVTPNPEPGELYVSPDCKTVKVGTQWGDLWLDEKIIERVYQGMGGPILSNDPQVLNSSMNAVARDMLQPWTDCAVKVPWPDWYVADAPVPTPQQGQSRAQFYQLMKNHRDVFVAQLATSFEQYKQLNDLIASITVNIEEVYLDRFGYDRLALIQGGDDLGGSQGKLSPLQKNRLRAMGYAITDEVIEMFQSDFNSVMMAWVGVDWAMDMYIEPTNDMDNATDDAVEFAWQSSADRGVAWMGMVSQATGLGMNGEPPKPQPNA